MIKCIEKELKIQKITVGNYYNPLHMTMEDGSLFYCIENDEGVEKYYKADYFEKDS